MPFLPRTLVERLGQVRTMQRLCGDCSNTVLLYNILRAVSQVSHGNRVRISRGFRAEAVIFCRQSYVCCPISSRLPQNTHTSNTPYDLSTGLRMFENLFEFQVKPNRGGYGPRDSVRNHAPAFTRRQMWLGNARV